MAVVSKNIIIATFGLNDRYINEEIIPHLPEFKVKPIDRISELEQDRALYLPEVLLTPEKPNFKQVHEVNCPQIILAENYEIDDWQSIKNAAYDARDEKIDYLFRKLIDSLSLGEKKHMSQDENLRLLREVRELISDKDSVSIRHLHKGAILINICAHVLDFSEQEIKMLIDAFLNHDIGKITCEDKLLNKPDRLTADEFRRIQNHVDALKAFDNLVFNDELAFISESIEFHHARDENLGYKDSLDHSHFRKYIELITIVDIMEALLAKRPYKEGLPLDTVLNIIKNQERGLNTEYVNKIYSCLSNCESKQRNMVLRLYRKHDDIYKIAS